MTAEDRGVGAGLPRPCLMLVTDRRLAGGEDALVLAVEEAVAGGVNVVQLREKDMPRDELGALAGRMCEVTRGRALCFVNSAVDVANDVGADGIHLPEDAPNFESDLIVGRSVHTVETAVRAENQGVDYVVAGPVFETRSHEGGRVAGVELIRNICEAVDLPVLGIGGVDYQRAATLVRAGAAGVAVISAILSAPSPRDAAARLSEALNEACREAGAAR